MHTTLFNNHILRNGKKKISKSWIQKQRTLDIRWDEENCTMVKQIIKLYWNNDLITESVMFSTFWKGSPLLRLRRWGWLSSSSWSPSGDSILLIFLVFFIVVVEMLLSMHINMISRVVCLHRTIEYVAINRQIEDAGRNICCLCDRTASRWHSAYAWICCGTVIDYNFLALPASKGILTHCMIGE